MTCNACGEKPKNTAKDFTKAVIEINNPETLVLLRKVVIPASMGDDTAVPPAVGKYRNVLLVYEANNHAYLYSSDGIPTLLTSDVAQDLEQKIDAVARDLQTETIARQDADMALDDRLTTVEGIAATALQPEAIDKVVMTDINLNPNTSTTTVQIDGAKENLLTGATTTKNIPLPVASHNEAGVMNSSTFDAVTNNSSNINALLNGAVAITGLSANPSQSDLTTAWQTQTGLTSLMNRASIYDVTNNKVWTYYANDDTWYAASNTAQVTINTFTNSSEGTILGSTNVGQVFAENDGTGSVNGWDALSGAVSTNTSNITSLQTAMAGKQDKLTAGANITISPTNVISATDTEYTAGNAITIENNTINADIYPADFFTNDATDTATGANITLDKTIPATLKSVELYGDTEQQTYSGDNLYDYSDTKSVSTGVTADSDGWITVTYDNTGSSTVYLQYFTDLLELANSTDYAIVLEVKSVTGAGGIDVCTSYQGQFTTSDNYLFSQLEGGKTYIRTETTKASFDDAIYSLRTVINFASGQSGSITFRISVLADTSVTPEAFIYQPYTGGVPAPNPNYPQTVNVVTGTQTIGITGKNLCALGTKTVETYTLFPLVKPLPAGTYTFSAQVTSTDTQSSTCFVRFMNGTSGVGAARINRSDERTYITVTTSDTADGLYLYAGYDASGSAGDTATYTDIQIEKGPTATDYEPYQSQTYTVNLGATELCKIGDYQDYIYKSGDGWYVHKACNKVVFDGTEDWSWNNNQVFNLVLTDNFPNRTTTNPYCDNFIGQTTSGYSQVLDEHISLQSTSTPGSERVLVKYLALEQTAPAFKTWLSTHNTTLYYPLATPTNTKITDTDLITDLNALAGAKSYLNVTNFNVTATGTNLPALLKPEAYAKSLYSIIELLNSFKNNLVVVLPNGMTTYPVGEAPLALDEAIDAFQQGRSIFFVDYASERTSIYTVSAVDANDGVWSMKVERIGANVGETAGYWVIGTSNTTQWRRVDFYPNINITMQTTDPGEGVALAANHFIGVYE